MGPTQPPIEWVPGALSPGVKRTVANLCRGQEYVDFYIHAPIRLNDVWTLSIVLSFIQNSAQPYRFVRTSQETLLCYEPKRLILSISL
jgi:hypothetical protein